MLSFTLQNHPTSTGYGKTASHPNARIRALWSSTAGVTDESDFRSEEAASKCAGRMTVFRTQCLSSYVSGRCIVDSSFQQETTSLPLVTSTALEQGKKAI